MASWGNAVNFFNRVGTITFPPLEELLSLTALTLGMFLVAAGSGHPGWAIVAGSALLLVVTTAVAVVGGTVHHDHKLGRDTPHFP